MARGWRELLAASRAKDKSRQIALACSIAAGLIVILLAVAMLDYWFMLPEVCDWAESFSSHSCFQVGFISF